MTKYLILTKYQELGKLEPCTKIEFSLGLVDWYQVDKAARKLAEMLGFHRVRNSNQMLGGYWASEDGMTILEAVSRDLTEGWTGNAETERS